MSFRQKTLLLPTLIAASLAVSACSDSDDNGVGAAPATQAPLDDSQVVSEAVPSVDAPDVPVTDTPGDVTPVVPPAVVEAPAVPPVDDAPVIGTPVVGTPAVDTTPVVIDPALLVPVDNSAPAPANTALPGDIFSGGQDDSPTATESLSLAGPSLQDAQRGAGPPSVPTGLTALMASDSWIEFSWAPSTDDQDVAAYEIYRDGQKIATVGRTDAETGYVYDYLNWINTTYMDCNFTRFTDCETAGRQPVAGTSYSYSVAAIDNEGMSSERSAEVVLSTVTPGQSAADLTGYQPVFAEEFDDTKLDRSRWKTSLPWGPDTIINKESQHFVNVFSESNPVAYDPFVFTGDTLQITGINTPADQLAAANNQPYLSGVLTTADYFEMTYGYVEMSAKLAAGQGMLSTFYLFNQSYYKNKPEIDIIEYIAARSDKAYQTYHYYDSNRARFSGGEKHSSPTMETQTAQVLSDDFHTYSVLWEPELVVWYIDGEEVRRLEGPRVSDEPMNIVTQLVMGSEWIGDPDPAAVPAVLEIDYIRAWQK